MKLLFLLLIFNPLCNASMAQQTILDKRSKIKKRMEHYYQENNLKYTFTETEKTLTYVLNDSLSLPATYVYYFNEQDRCEKQETIFSCDSCLQKSIQQSLENKFTNWQKIAPATYYAGFPYNTLMEPVKENGRFILRYTWMKRKNLKSKAITNEER